MTSSTKFNIWATVSSVFVSICTVWHDDWASKRVWYLLMIAKHQMFGLTFSFFGQRRFLCGVWLRSQEHRLQRKATSYKSNIPSSQVCAAVIVLKSWLGRKVSLTNPHKCPKVKRVTPKKNLSDHGFFQSTNFFLSSEFCSRGTSVWNTSFKKFKFFFQNSYTQVSTI